MAELLKENVVALINQIMKLNSWSASRLAREAGVSPSTITRALDPKNPFMPSGTTISKLIPLAADTVFRITDETTQLKDELASAYTKGTKATRKQIPVLGSIQAGVWQDSSYDVGEVELSVSIIDSQWDDADVFAYKIIGDASDREYKDGTIVILQRWPENDLKLGDICVLRRAVDFLGSRKFELTMWDIGEENGEMTLTSRSVGPSEKIELESKPLRVKSEPLGIVVAAYHRLDRNKLPDFSWRKKS